MKVYQIYSSIGGLVSASDLKLQLVTQKICLTYLVQKLYEDNHVEGISLEEFQDRLAHGLREIESAFDLEEGEVDDEIYDVGTYTCEFDWPTSSSPKEFSSIFEISTNVGLVFREMNVQSQPLDIVQIGLSDDEDNWISFSEGGIDAQEGFMVLCWKEDAPSC